MSRITILHGVNYWNAGDLGIMRSMVLRLRQEIPSARIEILSIFGDIKKPREILDWDQSVWERPYLATYPLKDVKEALEAGIGLLKSLVYCFLLHILGVRADFLLTVRQASVINGLAQSDVVVSKGGNFLWDKGKGIPGFTLHLHQILLSILLRRPTVIYAQSIGPFVRPWTYRLLKPVLRRVDLILLREPCSLEFTSDLGGTQVRLTADEAFLLPAITDEQAQQLLRANGVEGECTVGFTVRDWFYPFSPDPTEKQRKYIESMAALADWFIEQRSATVFFVPHLVGFWGVDDLEVTQKIVNRTSHKERIHILGTLTAEEIKGILGEADIVVGTRMHSNIFALSEGTPCLVISYLPKSTGIMRMLGLEEWLVPIEDVTAEGLCAMAARLLRDAHAVRAHLARVVPEMERRARENASLVRALIGAHDCE